MQSNQHNYMNNWWYQFDVGTLLIKLTTFLVLFNGVLLTLGIPLAYVASMLILIVSCLFYRFNLHIFSSFLLEIFYVFTFIFICLIQVAFFTQDVSALSQLALYILPLVCWLIYFTTHPAADFGKIFSSVFPLAIFVAMLGVIQYFYSPTLWGIISVQSKVFEWTNDKSFSQYSAFFRASSVLGSPQVFGLFCALNMILAHRFKRYLNNYIFALGTSLLFFAGGLSGNKLFFLIVLAYFLLVFFHQFLNSAKYIAISLVVAVVIVFSAENIIARIPMLERVVSVDQMIKQEEGGGRLDRYKYILENTNFIIGSGLGNDSKEKHTELKAAESYIFKIYFESGITTTVLLITIILSSTLLAYRISFIDALIVGLILLSILVVHAFQSPVFFLIWGYLMSFKSFNCKEID